MALGRCANGPQLEPPSRFDAPIHLSCVPYARSISGIELDGNANEWWREAVEVYQRAHRPKLGALLVFKPSGAMDADHLAVVTALKSPREVLVA
ncbi:CHAP domain-containing protein [Acidocella sp.]|uniref:CHAP domain-containing protein n=1 Tax=Acidocella sp. TaxID=50710 RepID=UPI0026303485|nr:CHAP domain-containing protein [Acidocella sp.]